MTWSETFVDAFKKNDVRFVSSRRLVAHVFRDQPGAQPCANVSLTWTNAFPFMRFDSISSSI